MTVQDLLTMRSGHETDPTMPMVQAANWAEAFLTMPIKFKPGTHFVYNSGATYMLSAIVQKLAGRTVLEYLEPRLFSPLGFGPHGWDSSPQGISTGGWGFMVTLEDIAKLGLLYLNKGNWQGKQLLSEAWVEEASSPHADNSITPGATPDWIRGYGYQFWRSRYGYRGDGAYGQYCLILPEFDAALALSSEVDNMQKILDVVWDHLVPAFNTANAVEERLNGREYRMEENPYGLFSVGFTFSADTLSLRFGSGDGATLEAGRFKWQENDCRLPFGTFSFIPVVSMAGDKGKISASFLWRGKELEVQLVYRNCPHRELLTFRFEENTGKNFRLKVSGNPAFPEGGRAGFEVNAVSDCG
jgi:hypothetical protein